MLKVKKILLSLPKELYEALLASRFRKESTTDPESIRSAIKYAIQNDTAHTTESQDKKDGAI